MENSGSSSFPDKLAGVVSVILHPFLVPVYGLTIIFLAPTIYNYLPYELKKLVILIVLVNNILLPISLMPVFVHRKIISSWFMHERKDRVIPLIISTILYSVTTYLIFRFPVPNFLKSFFIALSFLSLMATVINLWWKISLHSIGAGMLIAIVLVLSVKMDTSLLWILIPVILAVGLLLSSRLQLKHSSSGQVWLGFSAGLVGFSAIAMLF